MCFCSSVSARIYSLLCCSNFTLTVPFYTQMYKSSFKLLVSPGKYFSDKHLSKKTNICFHQDLGTKFNRKKDEVSLQYNTEKIFYFAVDSYDCTVLHTSSPYCAQLTTSLPYHQVTLVQNHFVENKFLHILLSL